MFWVLSKHTSMDSFRDSRGAKTPIAQCRLQDLNNNMDPFKNRLTVTCRPTRDETFHWTSSLSFHLFILWNSIFLTDCSRTTSVCRRTNILKDEMYFVEHIDDQWTLLCRRLSLVFHHDVQRIGNGWIGDRHSTDMPMGRAGRDGLTCMRIKNKSEKSPSLFLIGASRVRLDTGKWFTTGSNGPTASFKNDV